MPKSFLFTNKRFTFHKQQYGNCQIIADSNFQQTSLLSQDRSKNHQNIEVENETTKNKLCDTASELSSIELNVSPGNKISRKEHTLPIIKQKERYRSFEIDEVYSTTIQPPAYYSFEKSVGQSSCNYISRYEHCDEPSESTPSPVKQCDTFDGDSDSGISLISEDSRHEYSPRRDFAYHCSDHLSLLFDFFSPRKASVRETIIDDRQEVRRVLDFSMPSLQHREPENSDIPEAPNSLTSDDEFACDDCGKRYSTSSNLTRHRQIHRSSGDKKARQCPHCEKVYVSMPAFSMHVRTHNQGCECPYCGKKFSRPWLLQGHIRTHTGEKPFACPQCSKCFADKSNLRAHVQTHSTEKPYVCSRCGKAFALKSYLYKHEESSCMRGQRSTQKRGRKSISIEDQTKAIFIEEQRRSSW